MTLKEAVAKGAKYIFLSNGTEIVYEGSKTEIVYEGLQKNESTKIICTIHQTKTPQITEGMAEIHQYSAWGMGRDYCIPEKVMDRFVCFNGGVDEYKTNYWLR